MRTLGVASVIDFKSFLSPEEHDDLLVTQYLGDLRLDTFKRDEIYKRLLSVKLDLYPDTEEMISRLKKENVTLAIVSNLYCLTPDLIRNLFPNLIRQFDVTTFSSEVGIKKPDARIFRHTLGILNEKMGLNLLPSEVVMIGDDFNCDISPALSLGMRARLIDRTKQGLEDVI